MNYLMQTEPDEPSEYDFRAPTMGEQVTQWVGASVDTDPERCGCHGSGWVLSPLDSWEPCPVHPQLQHPEECR